MISKDWLIINRKKLNLSQRELAYKCEITLSTIQNIEQGKRLGSIDTWDKIENFFGNTGIQVSYECDDLIEKLKADIDEFGEDEECYLFYKNIDGGYMIFTNYDFVTEEKPVTDDELEEDEKIIKTTLKYTLEVFENQNKVI